MYGILLVLKATRLSSKSIKYESKRVFPNFVKAKIGITMPRCKIALGPIFSRTGPDALA